MGIIKIFGGNFAPKGWAFCNGQAMAVSQYSALFSLLGTTYGGDGVTTFNLPDLRGRTAVGMGAGPGLSIVTEGQIGGSETVTLTTAQMPPHNHNMAVSSGNASQGAATSGASIAAPGTLSGRTFTATLGFNTTSPDTVLNPASVSAAGLGMPHNNMQPFLGVNYIICLEGLYPSRN